MCSINGMPASSQKHECIATVACPELCPYVAQQHHAQRSSGSVPHVPYAQNQPHMRQDRRPGGGSRYHTLPRHGEGVRKSTCRAPAHICALQLHFKVPLMHPHSALSTCGLMCGVVYAPWCPRGEHECHHDCNSVLGGQPLCPWVWETHGWVSCVSCDGSVPTPCLALPLILPLTPIPTNLDP